jgi:hypothetical protein
MGYQKQLDQITKHDTSLIGLQYFVDDSSIWHGYRHRPSPMLPIPSYSIWESLGSSIRHLNLLNSGIKVRFHGFSHSIQIDKIQIECEI